MHCDVTFIEEQSQDFHDKITEFIFSHASFSHGEVNEAEFGDRSLKPEACSKKKFVAKSMKFYSMALQFLDRLLIDKSC